jgi:hypothetical protein
MRTAVCSGKHVPLDHRTCSGYLHPLHVEGKLWVRCRCPCHEGSEGWERQLRQEWIDTWYAHGLRYRTVDARPHKGDAKPRKGDASSLWKYP